MQDTFKTPIQNFRNWQALVLPPCKKNRPYIDSYGPQIRFSCQLRSALSVLFESIHTLPRTQKTTPKFTSNCTETVKKTLQILTIRWLRVNSETILVSFKNYDYSLEQRQKPCFWLIQKQQQMSMPPRKPSYRNWCTLANTLKLETFDWQRPIGMHTSILESIYYPSSCGPWYFE